MTVLKPLPIGVQDFAEVISGNYLYVDKTQPIASLITSGKYFFLSRPRRFGKSLMLSTIKAIYQGQHDLFKGLWIENNWDWSTKHPVVHISFSDLGYRELDLTQALRLELAKQAENFNIVLSQDESIALMFSELLRQLAQTYGKVVLLIDEYDKPLIDYLDDDSIDKAKANQQVLKTFYSIIKGSDPYLQFLLITGVSKFSKLSIFSDLNHLYDLTLAPEAATLLGYTQAELESNFADYLPLIENYQSLGRADLLEKIRSRYNGYSWNGRERVYNPFSILNFFRAKEFYNFWFETGTPTFLLKLLRKQHLYRLDNLEVSERSFASYDLEHLQAIPILFQTGYLTIKSRNQYGIYTLDYPNTEVRESLLDYIISDLRHTQTPISTPIVVDLHLAFQANDLDKVMQLVRTVFKTIPSQIFIKDAESYYHSLIYLVFFYLGVYAESEVNTSDGRLDCVVKTASHIYVLEFKLDQSAAKALQQIRDKGYAEKYRADGRQKVLVGVNFSSEHKTVESWVAEDL